MTREEWMAEARERFGDDPSKWRFVCPVCGTVQTAESFKAHTELDGGQISGVLGFSCIGRFAVGGCDRPGLGDRAERTGKGTAIGCNYTGGGLFKLNPVEVEHDGRTHQVFAFAELARG